jgi:hypothetical protein
VVANTLKLFRDGAVGFISWLDELAFMIVLWQRNAASASALAQYSNLSLA